jgi:hypothetical protein
MLTRPATASQMEAAAGTAQAVNPRDPEPGFSAQRRRWKAYRKVGIRPALHCEAKDAKNRGASHSQVARSA